MALTVAVLESLFTANVKDFDKKAMTVQTTSKKITDTKIVSQVDADISKAQKNATRLKTDLKVLESLATTPEVTADIAKATSSLEKVDARLTILRGARAEMVVVADVKKAEKSLDDVATKAGTAGSKGGKDAGEGLSDGILGALVALPIAGTVIGIGAVIGKSLMDGLQVEVRSDRLMAQTGLDAATVAVLARASGEAYADNFGESIAANMDTAKVAIQGGLLNPGATAKDSQAVISSLSGVADIIGEEIAPVARATATLIRTGLAKDSAAAFDIIVKGSQAGLNVSEDLIDTLNEYSTQFRVLGLDGPQALGLLSQAVKGGARDTDTAADALKEFAIRAVDGSKLTADSYKAIGLSAEDMAAKVIAGGPTAAGALELTLTKLREMEPGAARTAAAVGLFGTKAEDLGAALFTMDLSTAVTQLGAVEGAAKSAIDTLGDNAAASIDTATRNITVAADGIKGALAGAFNPQIEGFATYVSENRAGVMQFLLDMGNGALDAGRSLANAAADGIEGFGDMVGYVGPAVLTMVGSIMEGIAGVAIGMAALDPTGMMDGPRDEAIAALGDFNKFSAGATESFNAIDSGSQNAADAIRENLIENGLDPAQRRLDAFGIPLVTQAAMHDASVALANNIDGIGYAADQSQMDLAVFGTTIDTSTAQGQLLEDQIRASVIALNDESTAAAAAGETQDQLNARYEAGRVALVNQLIAMGYTQAEADTLAASYGAIPANVATAVTLDKAAASAGADTMRAKYDGLGRPIETTLTFTVRGYEDARAKYDGLGRPLKVGAATGGAIYGPGTGTSDSIDASLSNGEHVLTADDVIDFGGQNAVYRMRALAQAGRLKFATGGAVQAGGGGVGTSAAPAPYGGPLVQIAVERMGANVTITDLKAAMGFGLAGMGLK